MTSSASARDSRARATSCTSEKPRATSAARDTVLPASPSAANATAPLPDPPVTAAAYFPPGLGSTGTYLALAEHNVELGRAVRCHLPPDRLMAGHLEVEVEGRGDFAVGNVQVVVTVLVGVRAEALAAVRTDDHANALERVPGLIDDMTLNTPDRGIRFRRRRRRRLRAGRHDGRRLDDRLGRRGCRCARRRRARRRWWCLFAGRRARRCGLRR